MITIISYIVFTTSHPTEYSLKENDRHMQNCEGTKLKLTEFK